MNGGTYPRPAVPVHHPWLSMMSRRAKSNTRFVLSGEFKLEPDHRFFQVFGKSRQVVRGEQCINVLSQGADSKKVIEILDVFDSGCKIRPPEQHQKWLDVYTVVRNRRSSDNIADDVFIRNVGGCEEGVEVLAQRLRLISNSA